MKLGSIWSFIAGDSKRTPAGIFGALILAFGLVRLVPAAGPLIGVAFVTAIAVALVAGLFES